MSSSLRFIGLFALVVPALVVLGLAMLPWRGRSAAGDGAGGERLSWVTTAHQHGVVGYRDPVGAISPDGTRVAYSEGRNVRVVPIGGGAPVVAAAADGQVRHLAWMDGESLVFEQTGSGARWWTTPAAGSRPPEELARRLSIPDGLRQLAPSPDGEQLAGVVPGDNGPQVWKLRAGAEPEMVRTADRPSWPAWMPSGDVACLVTVGDRTRIAVPCAGEPLVSSPDVDAVGPIAFSTDGATVYFASPNARGMVDLWAMIVATRRAARLTSFSRDTYAPSVAADRSVLFKTQSYRTFVAALDGGVTRQLTTFQAETPSWHPTLPLLAVTYGTWRRVVDDAKYPDIAQEIGLVDVSARDAADRPHQIVADSDSEDQAMTWSPNGKWIAFHSHREMSDDVWLRPADGSRPDRRITFLGRGAEVGWPRWSPDGRTVLLDGASPRTGRSALFVIGVDQESGAVTSDVREMETAGFIGDITHGEWLPDGRTIVAAAKASPGRHVVLSAPVSGGPVRVLHRYETEHDFPGLGVSPDGRWVAFVAPAPDGFFQIFRVPVEGGTPEQITRDRAHKTQPTYAPTGDRLAYTVWSYEAQFWAIYK